MRWEKHNLTNEQKKQYRIDVALLLLKNYFTHYDKETCRALENMLTNPESKDLLCSTYYFLVEQYISKKQIHPLEFLVNLEIIDINHTDKEGKTILHHAVERCVRSSIMRAIDCGAQFTTPDREGNTPLHYASLLDCYAPLKDLLNH